MVCIYCGSETKVINSRPQKKLNHIWRRRQCLACGNIFTTSEKPDLTSSIMVRKMTALKPFSRDKLMLSVYESCKHRKTALSDSQALTDTIISKLLPHSKDATISIEIIIKTAAEVLQNFDKAAYTHYTAFHPG